MRIFIAEDNSIALLGIIAMLEQMGHTVAGTAGNGEDACRLLRQTAPDMAILDINMPKMSGIEVLKAVGQEVDIPYIFLTAYSDESLILEASSLGAVGYVLKPVTADQLKAQIEIGASQKKRLRKASEDADHYKKALEDRKLIERAKGILMDRLQLREEDAMRRLQKKSRDENKKLTTIAKEIIDANKVF